MPGNVTPLAEDNLSWSQVAMADNGTKGGGVNLPSNWEQPLAGATGTRQYSELEIGEVRNNMASRHHLASDYSRPKSPLI